MSTPLSEAYRRSAQALNVIGGQVEREEALVRITSSSQWRTTLVDFGKNARNVRRFLDWVGR